MKIEIDYWIKNKCGNPNFSIYHLIINEDDIKKMVKQKIKDNPPVELQCKDRVLCSIEIDRVII